MGPYGHVGLVADEFVDRLAEDERLIIDRNVDSGGLVSSFKDLELADQSRLSPNVIDFYENTTQYDLNLWVDWNPFFRPFGSLVQRLYSLRLQQLNLPLRPLEVSRGLSSEVVTLTDPRSGQIRYTIWYRVIRSSGQVMYSGIYTTCKLPCGRVCVKAIFPLPRGSATVLLEPSVGDDGALRLVSSGTRYGDPGFYFLVQDSKGGHWAQYVRSFREQLNVFDEGDQRLRAEHELTLWRRRVLEIHYEMNLRPESQKSDEMEVDQSSRTERIPAQGLDVRGRQ